MCEAQASPDPMYTCYHYVENGTKRELNDPNANNGELYIRDIKPFDRGHYSCVPNNPIGQGEEAWVYVSVLCKYLFAQRISRLCILSRNVKST